MCNTSNSNSLKERVKCYINKRDEIIKARKHIENGCNFPSLMTISKYPEGASGTIGRYRSIYPYAY